ncbi:MAG: monovalent cation/H+ antiporter subunit D family protein [Motiliproteus sp.]
MNIFQQLPLIVVILPLLAAPLCVLLGRGSAAHAVAVVVTGINVLAALALLEQVSATGTVRYFFGGWPPPWGIEYRIDLLGGYVLLLVTGVTAMVVSAAGRSVAKEIPASRSCYFYSLVMLATAGFCGIIVAGDAFNLFVFLEISSLASYALISMGQDRRALRAAFQYLIIGSIGATFILIGIGFLFMMTGTLNMQDLADKLPAVAQSRAVRTGFAFLTLGIGLKLAIFPLHMWLPNAYCYAPSVVSALLSATATKVSVYVLLRFSIGVFGIDFSLRQLPLDQLLLVLGCSGVLFASWMAVFENNVKRMLAYSSVAQLGYMVLALGLASAAGITATILHLFNHGLMKAALFLAVAGVVYRIGGNELQDFSGLGRAMPWTMAAFLVAACSLIGVPLTVGFVSKWYLLSSALEQGQWLVVVVIVVGSLLALIYMWKVLEVIYFRKPETEQGHIHEAPLSMLLPLWVLVLANIYFGIDTQLTVGVAEQAAQSLLGGRP